MSSVSLKKLHKPTWYSWYDMVRRCTNPKSCRWHTHGGRGITVCEEWIDSPEAFLKDMGLKPDGHTIERVDNNKGYNKENCCWATPKQQARNRRTTRLISYKGITETLNGWSAILGISASSLTKRLHSLPIEQALSISRYCNQTITEDKKIEILIRYYSGEMSQESLATLYSISQGAISKWVCSKIYSE